MTDFRALLGGPTKELEVSIEDKFVEACQALGLWAVKFTAKGTRHLPDRLVLCPGEHCFFVEFKRKNKKMRSAQDAMADEIEKLGFKVYRDVDSEEKWKRILVHEIRTLRLSKAGDQTSD